MMLANLILTLSVLRIAAPAPLLVVHEPFAQEQRTAYTTETGLPGSEAWDVALLPDGAPVALLGRQDVVSFDGRHWGTFAGLPFYPRFLDTVEDVIWLAQPAGVSRVVQRRWEPLPAKQGMRIRCLVGVSKQRALVGTDDGVWEASAGGIKQILKTNNPILALDVSSSGEIAFGTEEGLFVKLPDAGPHRLLPHDERYSWAVRHVSVVTYDSRGRLWFGSPQGAGVRESDGSWKLYTGREGLPWNKFTCAAPGEDGVVWFGTTRGAIRFDGKHWAYRASLRWLPDDHVNAIAVDAHGTAWIATPGGISRIERKKMTLADKAAYFEEQTEARHNRDGFVLECRLRKRGDLNTWEPTVSDNDGQYTSLYGSAEVFRYAATKDPEAKRRARRSFEACKKLIDVTPMPGFPARVVVPIEWLKKENLIEIYGREYNKRKKKEDPLWKLIYPRWVKSKDGKWLWKCDTSSDEVVGHLFFYSLYYDLVAETAEEKKEVADVFCSMVDHIIDNGFVLRDWDGKPTRWSNWSPDYLNSAGGFYERGLNSLMMLAMLATAEHMTGDKKYANVAAELRDKHHYHINTYYAKLVFPPMHDVPWDYMLSLLSYYPLLRYEKDPALRERYLESLDRTWLAASRHEHPFYNFLYLALVSDQPSKEKQLQRIRKGGISRILTESIETLRGIPLELIGWEMPNSHRLDVVLDPMPGRGQIYGWSVVDGGAIPVEERAHVRLDRSALRLDNVEGNGYSEHEGTFFLLPYYIGLYHGFLK